METTTLIALSRQGGLRRQMDIVANNIANNNPISITYNYTIRINTYNTNTNTNNIANKYAYNVLNNNIANFAYVYTSLLYPSDAADEGLVVVGGGSRTQ